MQQKEHHHSSDSTQAEPCASAHCGAVIFERLRYYTGRYMAARDFCDEQAYFLSRCRLRNRLLHGWGIVCGLDVTHHPDKQSRPYTDCAKHWVVIHAGLAIDCCGRELILPKDWYYELKHLQQPTAEPKSPDPREEKKMSTEPNAQTGQESTKDKPATKRYFLLGLQYKEDLVECVPALYAEGACDPKKVEANRVHENVTLVEVDYTVELKGNCWADPTGSTTPTYYDDCTAQAAGPVKSCLKPECPCGDMVPLALIGYDPANLQEGFTISLLGRRQLPPAPDVLTHVVSISWPHGGVMSLSELKAQNWELRVTFDRDLLDPESHDYQEYIKEHPYGLGVNEHTFLVHCHPWMDAAFVPLVLFNDTAPPAVRNKREAVFTIDDRLLTGRATIVSAWLYVTIKCDFILDCHGRPIDGNHSKGRLRTGNGMPGGVFESWFRIVADEAEGGSPETPAQSGRPSQSSYWSGSKREAQ